MDDQMALDQARELTPTESMMLDDLRWCAGRLEQLEIDSGSELIGVMRQQMDILLSDWTASPSTYSNGLPTVMRIQPRHHLYNPPHRRGTTTEERKYR
jgi:hypothetical protein